VLRAFVLSSSVFDLTYDVSLGVMYIVAGSVYRPVKPPILSIGSPNRQQQKHNERRQDLNYPSPRHLESGHLGKEPTGRRIFPAGFLKK